MLMTGRAAPDLWNLGTPDLLSRLRLAPLVRLGAPDLELTEAVLFKLFSDRQLAIEPRVVAYIAPRIERSLAAARAHRRCAGRRGVVEGPARDARDGRRVFAGSPAGGRGAVAVEIRPDDGGGKSPTPSRIKTSRLLCASRFGRRP